MVILQISRLPYGVLPTWEPQLALTRIKVGADLSRMLCNLLTFSVALRVVGLPHLLLLLLHESCEAVDHSLALWLVPEGGAHVHLRALRGLSSLRLLLLVAIQLIQVVQVEALETRVRAQQLLTELLAAHLLRQLGVDELLALGRNVLLSLGSYVARLGNNNIRDVVPEIALALRYREHFRDLAQVIVSLADHLDELVK